MVIMISFSCVQVCSVLDDIATDSNTSSEHCLTRSYDVVLDKGTYDAICMNPVDSQKQRRKYHDAVMRLVCSSGLFIITSCNWTQAELLQQFSTGNKIAVFCDSFGAGIL